ncbi:hypothetical protein G4V62_13980 [Bacillaceae bacterium SIJ1]|uniref:hypothetical protein n=1 Tax=Litoribacterium kuwaitense TaxID=1398745 RepID=UPI0013EA043E|nr:hypothetical protein [Litoribacterium kuwaitense]NGP46003.1 hypothetical protein [Litoribacterium kuwaitense]
MDFIWDDADLSDFAELWRGGMSLVGIAGHFRRDIDECALAVMHLARENRIKRRRNGIFENEEAEDCEN